ncbi:SseB family protein (plasmid) [Coraliomargarita sp. W4R53]
MALFSRRPKDSADQTTDAETDVTGAEADATQESVADPTTEAANSPVDAADEQAASTEEPTASVGISMSSYGGFGATRAADPAPAPEVQAAPAPARPPAPETAPPPHESLPGLRDNVLMRSALAEVSSPAASTEVINVVRQMLQGHLYLRVKGDARALIAEGKPLPLSMATLGEKNYVLAYTSGAALQESVRADGDTATSAMGQPVLGVIRHVLAGSYAGVIIDHASAPARVTLPRELLEKVMAAIDEKLTIKTLLAAERTDETAAAVAMALETVPMWIAIGKTPDDRPGVAEGRSADGSRFLEVYSHPLEVAAVGRGNHSAPITAAQLATALKGDEGLSGVVVDPAGPWIRISREQLAGLLADTES